MKGETGVRGVDIVLSRPDLISIPERVETVRYWLNCCLINDFLERPKGTPLKGDILERGTPFLPVLGSVPSSSL